jgi:hypothetical protein
VISDDHRFPPNPEKLSILSTIPEQDATEVSPDVQVDLCMSGLVDPRSITDADATLSSGGSRFDSALSVQLVPWSGPGGSVLPVQTEQPWCRGSVLSITPHARLGAGVLHRVRLRPTVRGWNGERLETEAPGWVQLEDEDDPHYIVEFTVAPRSQEEEEEPAQEERERERAPTLVDLFSAGAVFDPQRQSCGCHTEVGDLAHALLDLRTPESAFEQLVVPTRSRDTGFPMVTPRRASESFVLHKLLHRGHGEPLEGVLGGPMPPDGPLPYLDLVQIARWIEGGANL